MSRPQVRRVRGDAAEGERSCSPSTALAGWPSSVLSHRKGARAVIRLAGTSDWTRRNFARRLFEDYPSAVMATPAR